MLTTEEKDREKRSYVITVGNDVELLKRTLRRKVRLFKHSGDNKIFRLRNTTKSRTDEKVTASAQEQDKRSC